LFSDSQSRNKRKGEAGSELEPASKKFSSHADPESCQNDPDSPPDFSRLPNEILLKIFSHIKTSDLLCNVARVSKRFYQLSQDPAAHISIHLGPVQIPEAFLEGKNKIEQFHVENAFNALLLGNPSPRNFYEVHDSLRRFLRRDLLIDEAILRQEKVQVIEMTGEHTSCTRIIEKLSENPGKAEKITTINIMQYDFYYAAVPNWINLKHLELNIRPFVIPSFSDYLFQIAMASNHLECLKSENQMKSSNKMSVMLVAKKNTLKKLQLPNYRCSEEDFETLTSNCDKIEELELDCSDISRQSIQNVFKLTNLFNLQITDLSSALSVDFVEKCIRSLPKLETLRLRFGVSYVFISDSFRSAEIRFPKTSYQVSLHDEIIFELLSLPRMSEVQKIKLHTNWPIRNVKLLERLQNSF
jgi:hypothetical protein